MRGKIGLDLMRRTDQLNPERDDSLFRCVKAGREVCCRMRARDAERSQKRCDFARLVTQHTQRRGEGGA